MSDDDERDRITLPAPSPDARATRTSLSSTPVEIRVTDIRDAGDEEVADELRSLVEQASSDERRVLLYLARRFVILGPTRYPRAFIDDDRDDEVEETEELADAMFYYSKRRLRRVTRPR